MKVLVIVSDGQDNESRYTKSELFSRAIESETQIYTVAIHTLDATRKPVGDRVSRSTPQGLDVAPCAAPGGRLTTLRCQFVRPSVASVSRSVRSHVAWCAGCVGRSRSRYARPRGERSPKVSITGARAPAEKAISRGLSRWAPCTKPPAGPPGVGSVAPRPPG